MDVEADEWLREAADEVWRPLVGVPLPAGAERPVHELVREVARTEPTRTAVETDSVSISYGDLVMAAEVLSQDLRAVGVSRGDCVAIVANPSAEMVVALLGVLALGAAYVPLDAQAPDHRLWGAIDQARVTAIVLPAGEVLPSHPAMPPTVSVRLDHPPVRLTKWAEVAADDAAYVIFTSGSTGEPKGVIVEHDGLATSTCARRMVYPGSPVFLMVSPLAFDSSAAGIWGTLTAGGRLVIAGREQVVDPVELRSMIARHRCTHVLCVPSLYTLLLESGGDDTRIDLATLVVVIVAGDVLAPSLLERHFAIGPRHARLYNEYGPTEATVWATYRCFEGMEEVSIGGPIPGTEISVLDERLRPVAPGVVGELCIGGRGLARGYLNRPDETAAAFVMQPDTQPPVRIYRTGDLCRLAPNGTLQLVGRSDDQVKVRGQRFHIGPVESALRAVPGVLHAAVVPSPDRAGLVAFVRADRPISDNRLRQDLANTLPPAMIPTTVRFIQDLPLTDNGKVDRQSLQHAVANGPSESAMRRPETVAAQLTVAWSRVLERDDILPDVNFFDQGGHSLTMFALQEAIAEVVGVNLSIVTLFRHPTIEAQASFIAVEGDRPGDHANGIDAPAQARAARLRRQRRQRPGNYDQESHL